MRTAWWIVAGALVALAGCVHVQAPREVTVGGGSRRPEPVDSGRVPATASHEDARRELEKAYANLRYLEQENARLADKAAEYREERDRYKRERDRLEDRLEQCEERLKRRD